MVVPVDVFVAGCPPPPWRILDGVVAAVPKLAEVRLARDPAGGPGEESLVVQAAGGRPGIYPAGVACADDPGEPIGGPEPEVVG
jgi:hypothetical protein